MFGSWFYTEALHDVSFRSAPIRENSAGAMIHKHPFDQAVGGRARRAPSDLAP
jgi:hypothetical protein